MARSSRGDTAVAEELTVINTEARFRRYPLQEVPSRFKDLPPHQRRVVVRTLVLKPGAQHVDMELWNHPNVQKILAPDLADQVIRVLEKPIHQLSERAAIRVVQMTIDAPILKGARALETRKKVLRAINKQLTDMVKTAHIQRQDLDE